MNLKSVSHTLLLPLLAAALPLQAEEDRPRPDAPDRKPEVRREEPKRPEPSRQAPAPERHEAGPPRREEVRRDEPRRPEGAGPVEPRRDAREPEGRPLPSPEERHRHLLEASEHLALAGFPEESRRVREQAERLLHAAREGRGPGPQGHPGHPGAEHAEAAHRALRELNARVEELSREVARLREAANQRPR